MKKPRDWSVLLGAAFLMATSAIGPGFLTQTAVFTARLGAAFAFVILMSVVLDIGAQLNVWRVIAVSRRRAQDIANAVAPGAGYVLSALVVLGGLAFNIGNMAGTGLGLNVLFGWSAEQGAVLSAGVAAGIFLFREAGRALDRFAQVLGAVMIVLTLYVAIATHPPLAEAALRAVTPGRLDILAIVTLVGGTVGGYITFAGGHRLLDAGVAGAAALPRVNRSAVSGILITALMRVALFLAVLGVVAAGYTLDPANPPASAFRQGAGMVGYKFFGIVLWAAAITSVTGSAYTSVSFLQSFHPWLEKHRRGLILGFILLSAAVFVLVGRPVKILVAAGTVNGLILPVSLGLMLLAAHRRSIVGDYRHPVWLTAFGALVVLLMAAMGGYTIVHDLPAIFR